MLRRREYAELHDEATDRQRQQLYNSDDNVPLVGLISGRHGREHYPSFVARGIFRGGTKIMVEATKMEEEATL